MRRVRSTESRNTENLFFFPEGPRQNSEIDGLASHFQPVLLFISGTPCSSLGSIIAVL